MLKNILKLDGAQALNKNEQRSIHGGIGRCDWYSDGCEGNPNRICCEGMCVPNNPSEWSFQRYCH